MNLKIYEVDDDMTYNSWFVEKTVENAKKNPLSAYSYWTYKVGKIRIGQGADGFAVNSDLLDDYIKFALEQLGNEPNWFYHDDFLLSTYLALHNTPITRDIFKETSPLLLFT